MKKKDKVGNLPLKATAVGPSNIAFTKYWGQQDKKLTLPNSSTISMTLDKCYATTTVHFSPRNKKDVVVLKFMDDKERQVSGSKKKRVVDQLVRLRHLAGVKLKAKVVSHTSFPTGAGIASSAAGFSALTLAASTALGLDYNKKELSIMVRLAGSGSACRSVYGGYVEWKYGRTSNTSYAKQIAAADHWGLCDIVAVTSHKEKKVSSLDGHQLAPTSPHYKTRLKLMTDRNKKVENAIMKKDIKLLGGVLEEDAIELHMIAMTSNPPIFYFTPATLDVIYKVHELRQYGVFCYFTLDAGPNVHIICERKDKTRVKRSISKLSSVRLLIENGPGEGARVVKKHLF